jgi:methionine sulfoxide reductase heme-binding subunit
MAMLWQDQKGAFSPLRTSVLALMALPAIWIAFALAFGMMGSKPVNAAIHETGTFAVRLLMFTLLITPLRNITGWVRIVPLRRLLGLGALAYAILHLTLYVVDERFDLVKVGSEIVLRFYLGIGFMSLIALVLLGITSTDSAIRRMGEEWHKLHRLIYPLTALALLHAFLQSKIRVDEAVILSGVFIILMGARVIRKRFGLGMLPLITLVMGGVAITMGIEYLWYALATGVPADRVFLANFDIDVAPRPALVVLMLGMVLPLASILRKPASSPPSRRARQGAIST